MPTKHRGRACTYWKQCEDGRPRRCDDRWERGKDEKDAAAAIDSLQRKADEVRGSTRDIVTRMKVWAVRLRITPFSTSSPLA